ncbi:MAG TPA: hypothetical protein VNC61_13925 [Acidimicrobiales bacterium]|nr:hypothetical protein [Acidimicrobiales bacterium]
MNSNDRLVGLNDCTNWFSGLVATLDPDALTASERAELYEVFVAVGNLGKAGRLMMEKVLAR